jgi:hypothetical protein
MTSALERLSATSKAIQEAKSFYFRREDAKELIEECDRKDLAVVGIEALTRKDDGGIIAHLDLIADFLATEIDWSGHNWESFRRKCNKAAVEFLDEADASGHPNLVFDCLVMEQGEFADYLERHEARRRMLGLTNNMRARRPS